MAKSNAKLASSKPVSTKWLQNAMRSIGVSTKNVLKSEFAPNLYEAVETGINTSKSVINTLRRNVGGTNQLSQQLQNNKYVKFAQTAYKNALSDLRSGNLNNEDRFGDSLFGDSGKDNNIDSVFEDSGFSFGDDEAESSVNINVVNASNNNDAMFAMTAQMQKHTEATLKTNQASMNAMIAMNSAAMMQNQQTNSLIVSGLDAINKNLTSLVEYNNSNLNKFIESSMAFYERMGAKFDNGESNNAAGDKKLNASDVINGSSGGINFGQYKQYIKQQFKETFSKTGLGMVAGMLDDNMLEMAASNPLGFATEGLIKFMIPKMLSNTIKGVEETFSSFMPAMLHKLSEWGDGQATGALGTVKQFIGKIFGIKIERTEKINKAAHIEKGPIPFDGQTKHAITEIITKELREQTSYLKIISNHFDPKNTKTAKEDSEVFDYKTGKYIKVSQVTENIMTEIKDAIVGSMNSTSFGKALRGYKDNLTNTDQIEAFNSGLDEFMVRLEKAGVTKLNDDEFNNKDSAYNKLLESLSGSKEIKKLIDAAVRDTTAKNPNAITGMSTAVLTAQKARNDRIRDIESNPSEYNLYAARGLDEKTLDELQDEYFRNQQKKGAKIDTSKKKEEKPTSLSDIGTKVAGFFGVDKDKDGNESTIAKTLNRFTGGLQNAAKNFIHGNGSDALDDVVSMVSDNFKTLWSKFDEKLLSPFKTKLFGTKNQETGVSEGGILSGLTNGFKDAAGMISHYITGKEFKDSKGTTHKIEEGKTSLFDSFKKIGSQVKDTVITSLFGEKVFDKDGNLTEEKKGLLSGFKNSIQSGLQGWKDALFGKEEDHAEQQKKAQSDILKTVKDRLPDAAAGAAIGAGVGIMSGGSLLGTLIGGPLGGAALGTAVGFMAKSEKFQNFLFGEEGKDGKRTGGLISKKVQDYFSKNKEIAIGGAAVGAIGGAITGGGVLGSLVGGPIAGSLIGMGTSLLVNSDKFQTFLFGEKDKDGKRGGGIFDKIKKKALSFGQSKDGDPNSGKLGGMMAIGAAGGGLLGSLVGGPIVGSVLGLGTSILAQKDNFHEWFFGKKDEKGNKKEGVLGKFRNMLTVNVFRPIGNMFKDIGADFGSFLKYDVLERVKISLEPITDMVSNTFNKITQSTINAVGSVGNYIKENFLDNFIENTGKLLAPLTNVVKSVTKSVYSIGKTIVSAPLKLLSAITSPIAQSVGRVVSGVAKTAFKGIDMLIVKPIKTLVIKPLAAVAKGLGKIVAAPFKLLGKIANTLNTKLTGFVSHLGNFTKRIGQELKSFIKNSAVGRWMQRRKEDMKDLTQHVKDAAVQFVSPLTDFVKVTIKSIGQHIKDGFKKLSNGVTGWFGNIGKKFLGLFGKKDKDGKPKKESTLARIWRETAPGKRTDMDAKIDPEASQSEKRRSLSEIIKEEREKNKQAAAERKKLERNEKLIAKYTGNQRADFTEENKRLAEYEAKKKGITIDWEDVEVRKTKEEELQEATLDIQTETRDYTKEIADFIMGRIKKDPAIEKKEQEEKGKAEGEAAAKRDAEVAEAEKNAETRSEKKAAKKAKEAQEEARKKESETRQEEMAQNLAGKDATGMSFFDGLKANWARVTSYWKGTKGTSDTNEDTESKEATTGDAATIDVPKKKFSKIRSLLDRFKGKGHAEGTDDTGDEAAIVGENGPELVNFSKGNKVFANSKPLSVVITGIDNKTKSGFAKLIEKIKNIGRPSSIDSDADSADVRSLAARNAAMGDGSSAATLISNLNGGNAGEEAEDDLHAATTMIESQKNLDSAQEAGHTAAELQEHREKEEAAERQASIDNGIQKLNETQKEHASNWSSIFSKKGLVTAGLLLAAPLIIKAIPTIVDIVKKLWPLIQNIASGIGSFISGVANQFGWTMNNGALGDGDTMGDKVSENANRATSLIDPNKSIGERVKGFVLNEDGQLDHQTDANAKLLVSTAGDALYKLGGGNKRLKKEGIQGTASIIKNMGKITYSVDDIAKAMGTSVDDVIGTFGSNGRISVDDFAKYMGTSKDEAFDFIHNGLKNSGTAKSKGIVSKIATKGKDLISKAGTKLANTKAGKAVTNVVTSSKNALTGFVSKSGTAIKEGASTLATKGKDLVSNVGTKLANSKVGTAVKKGGTKLVDAASSLLKPVLDNIHKWIDDIIEAVGKKMGKKLGSGILSGVLKNMTDIVTKFFSKISAKISAIFTKEGAIAASNAAFGLGVVIKATEITLSAINGASGAARLFQVDPEFVDGKMTAIATILGAAQGTMIGSIIDVVNELVASVTGVDILSEIATVVYNAWAGEEKAAALKAGKEAFKEKYLDYQDKELTKQYETAKKAGLIDGELSYDDYKKGVQDGTYKAKYDSFTDYNDKQHKTLGAKIGDGAGKFFKGIGKGISKGWSSVFGKNEKFLEDNNGTKYYDNKDGTYQVISATGEDLGYISKESLPAELSEKKDRKKGIFEKGFDGVKSFFAGGKDTAYFASDGSYYDSKGIHYTASGEKIGEITTDELQTMIVAGTVTKGEINKEAGIKKLGKTVTAGLKSLGNGIKNGWNKFKDGVTKLESAITEKTTKLWNGAKSFVSKQGEKLKAFLTTKTATGWFDTNGGYYVLNGESYDYYNSNGDKMSSGIPLEEVSNMIQSGNLTEQTVKVSTKLGETIKSIGEAKDKMFAKIKDIGGPVINSIGDAGTQLWTNIKKEGLVGGVTKFFKKQTSTVWFDPNGNYYKANGDVYDYYNANNDLISSGIDAKTVQEKIEAGLLTEGTATTDSEAKKAVDKIKSSVADAWNKAKETVSNGWSKFTSWLTGKGGSIANITSSNYGDKSIIDNPDSFYGIRAGGPRNKPVKGMRSLNIGGSLSAQDVLSQYTVSSNYGNRTLRGNAELHTGIDLTNTVNSPINSFTSGKVYKVVSGTTPNSGSLSSTDGGGFGNYVVVKDENGNYNYYAHMNGTSVKQGDTVNVGDKLGILGHTGRSTGPHLHYEVRKDPTKSGTLENTYDPAAYLDGTASSNTTSSGNSSMTDILSKLSGFFSEFSNRAMTGFATGKFDSNYDAYFADNNFTNSSSDDLSTSYSADTSNYVKINTTENAKKIWNYYKSRGIPDNTIAGILGNMQAESGLNPRNLQNSYEKSLGHTDDSYTTAVDSGRYTNFIKDAAGYGLVQWTYHSLKKALLDYAKKKGKSIGDLDMQLEFLVKQLSEDYPTTWKKMLAASSPEEASTIMLKEFEKPAVLNTNTRAGYAKQYFNTLASNTAYGGTTIKPRIVKRNNTKDTVYGGPEINSINPTLNAVKEYDTANSASKYISNTSNNNISKAINMIISLLEAITGNTASTSSKLDMLENLKRSNIVKGGDTTNNIITNNDNSKSSSNPRDILNQGSGTKVSRNQKLAERIAQGI